ncbi:MAG: exodeoxyribonuclease VII large subunit [Proteobacteria bacterium]|nr:exodeoxyribonuclease VII large subunit [Pseudomonadota bacterium]
MENRLIFTVSELTRQIKDSLETLFPNIWVEGEISNLRTPSSGHHYFTLKDSQSQIRAVMFRSQQRTLEFTAEDGLRVICRGRVNVYEPRGEYQLLVETMEPKGKGALQLAFEQLKKKLQEEGLFDADKKRPLPFLPERIAIITSPTGAALRDILKILNRRFPNREILIVPVKVQGDEAPDEIIQALRTVNNLQAADVIMVTRGGGSLEDLWAFNQERVARAIFESAIPVISAIGHEIDFTIADFVADLRAPTPSAAAELVVRDKRELKHTLSQYGIRLGNAVSNYFEQQKNNIRYLSRQLKDPAKIIVNYQLQCDDLHLRLVKTVPRIIRQKKAAISHFTDVILVRSPRTAMANSRTKIFYLTRTLHSQAEAIRERNGSSLKNCIARLNDLNPLNILNRGYSITRLLPSGQLVKAARQLHAGDTVDVKLGEGEAYCIVDKVVL